MNVDYIIAGQGISGTFLSYYLLQAGKKVLVIDEFNPVSASRIASGVVNPVTGRRVVTTWMIDELLPFAVNAYREIGESLSCNLVTEIDMVNFHTSQQMQSAWHSRIDEGCEYIFDIKDRQTYDGFFAMPYGAGITHPCLLVNLDLLLSKWRQKLIQQECLSEVRFNIEDVTFSNEKVLYKSISADKLILCNGTGGFDNMYFSRLPFTFNKGQALIIEIKGLPASAIYKYGISLVPLCKDIFWAGSSFEWEYDNEEPTATFRRDVENTLNKWLKLPYEVLEHKASIRPASIERRPFVGLHPVFPYIGILNGMGTKGCSLAPYFAAQFAANLVTGSKIHPEADIARFRKLITI
ncbi:MAG: FAD-binding oxidoreductase [Candidatus Kuenenia stuttgartiensis]|nr:FAD-binding oxidoreductase [Candidatus Kuenenia stuttgartiensis]